MKQGRSRGYSIDLLRRMALKTGLRLEFSPGDTWSGLMTKLRDRKLDLLSAVVETKEREPFMAFTDDYLTLPTVPVTREDGVTPFQWTG